MQIKLEMGIRLLLPGLANHHYSSQAFYRVRSWNKQSEQ